MPSKVKNQGRHLAWVLKIILKIENFICIWIKLVHTVVQAMGHTGDDTTLSSLEFHLVTGFVSRCGFRFSKQGISGYSVNFKDLNDDLISYWRILTRSFQSWSVKKIL